MKFDKKSELGIKTLLLIAIPLLGFWIYNSVQDYKAKENYLNSLNVQLIGIVRYVYAPSGSNGFGIIGVDVLKTNKKIVDTSAVPKYCLVKNNRAEFYQLGAEDCNLGDTIEVNTDQRIFTIKKPNGERKVEDVVVYENEFFWKYVKKHTRFQ